LRTEWINAALLESNFLTKPASCYSLAVSAFRAVRVVVFMDSASSFPSNLAASIAQCDGVLLMIQLWMFYERFGSNVSNRARWNKTYDSLFPALIHVMAGSSAASSSRFLLCRGSSNILPHPQISANAFSMLFPNK